MDGARDVAVSPGGDHVYVVSVNTPFPGGIGAVALFRRSPTNGALTFVEAYQDGGDILLDGASGVTVSPDGSQVYVASFHDDTLMVFDRNPADGTLTVAQSLTDGVRQDGLDGAKGVTTSPDGSQVYVASSDELSLDEPALAVFNRDPTDGRLTTAAVYKDGLDGVDGIGGATKLAASPGGEHVYVTGFLDNAVAAFSIAKPSPILNSLSPNSATVGDLAFTLTLFVRPVIIVSPYKDCFCKQMAYGVQFKHWFLPR